MRICHQVVINTAVIDRWTNVNSLEMVMYDKAYDKANGKNSDIKKKITHEIASINMPPPPFSK